MNATRRTIAADRDSTPTESRDFAAASNWAASSMTDEGESPLAAELRRTPELIRDRSLVIDKAVDEFMAFTDSNPALSARAYSRRFAAFGSSIESSIYRQLEVEQYVSRRQPMRDWAAELRWPAPGEQLGSFEIVEELGRGALARVYLGRQLDVGGRQVVVKVCRSATGEAHTLGQLRHRNIVPIFSVTQDDQARAAILCMPFSGTQHAFRFSRCRVGRRRAGHGRRDWPCGANLGTVGRSGRPHDRPRSAQQASSVL